MVKSNESINGRNRDMVNKQELAQLIAESMNFELSATIDSPLVVSEDEFIDITKQIIDTMWDVIHRETENGRIVNFQGKGRFLTKVRQGHTGRNPRTGEDVSIQAHRTFVFVPSRAYRRKLRQTDDAQYNSQKK